MAIKNSKNTEIKSGPRGQKLVTSSGRDDSSFEGGGGKSSFVGGKMGGSASSLDHSIQGATANMHGTKGK